MSVGACFYVLIAKSKTTKTGFVVQLQFGITQHVRDIEVFNRLKEYLNCGNVKKTFKRILCRFFSNKIFGDWKSYYSLFT